MPMKVFYLLLTLMIPLLFAGCPEGDDDYIPPMPEPDLRVIGFWQSENDTTEIADNLFFGEMQYIVYIDSLVSFDAHKTYGYYNAGDQLSFDTYNPADESFYYALEFEDDNTMVLSTGENSYQYNRAIHTPILEDSVIIDCTVPTGYALLNIVRFNKNSYGDEEDLLLNLKTFFEPGIHRYVLRPNPSFVNGDFAIDLVGIENEKIVSIERQYYSIEY